MSPGIITQRRPIDREMAAIKKLTESLGRGDLVKTVEIEKATGIKKGEYPWPRVIKHWKAWFQQGQGITPVAEPGIGYRLPTVEQQAEHALRLEKSGGRRLAKAAVVVGVIDVDELNDTGKALQKRLVDDVKRLQHVRKEQAAERRPLLSAHQALPRLRVNTGV